jgi:Core-2/I-Branching enzyme
MKLACIVLAHRNPEQLALLLSVLRHDCVSLYLHVERRSAFAPFARALSDAGLSHTVLLPRRDAHWGGVGLVDATVDGLARAMADGCDYAMLISGQDFPLRPVQAILSFAEEAGQRSYVRHWPLPTPRWRFDGRDRTDFYTYDFLGRRETCIPRGEDVSSLSWRGRTLNAILRMRTARKPPRRFPHYARAFGGTQWLNLSRAAAEHVLGFLADHPDYRRYHEYSLAPDEIFFQSILVGTGFADLHEVKNDDLRLTIWPEGGRHPRTLQAGDLEAMLASQKLFARKLDPEVDATVLTRLTERLTG